MVVGVGCYYFELVVVCCEVGEFVFVVVIDIDLVWIEFDYVEVVVVGGWIDV